MDDSNKKDPSGTPFSNFLNPELRDESIESNGSSLLKLVVKKKKTKPILLQTLTPTKNLIGDNIVSAPDSSTGKYIDVRDSYRRNTPGVIDLNQQIAFLHQQFEEDDDEDDEFIVNKDEIQRIEMEDDMVDIQLQNENPPTNGNMSVATDPPTMLTEQPTGSNIVFDSHSKAFTPLNIKTPSSLRRQHNPIIKLNRNYSYADEDNPVHGVGRSDNKRTMFNEKIEEEEQEAEEEEEEEEEDYEEDLEAFDDEADKILDEIEYRRLFKTLKNNTREESIKINGKKHEVVKDNINNAVNVIGSYGIPITEETDRKIFQTENEKNMDNILKNMGVDLLNFNEKDYNEEEDLDYVVNEEEEEIDEDDEDFEDDLVNDLENEDDLMWFGHNYLNDENQSRRVQSQRKDNDNLDFQSNKFEERPHVLHDKLKLPDNEGEFDVTLYPIYPAQSKYIPSRLVNFLRHEYNQEILKGVTLPYLKQMNTKEFIDVWFKDKDEDDYENDEHDSSEFSNLRPMDKGEFDPHDGVLFILVLDSIDQLSPSRVNSKTYKDIHLNQIKWESQCLGIFNIIPCYEGRSSHICTANFLVNEGIRNKSVGSFLMEKFLYWAPKLGYAMVQFPLIYDTNTPIIKLLDKFHFQILGKLPNSGVLLGYSDPISSTSYYKNLIVEDDQYNNILTKTVSDGNVKGFSSVSRSKTIQNYLATTDGQVDDVDSNGEIIRFKLLQKFMLTNKYPFPNMSRAYKARLRSLRYRYQLDGEGRLYLKGREVISNIFEQKNIVREVHNLKHWQINKMNRVICKDYYWPGLRKTVLKVFSECKICNDSHKRRNIVVNGYNPPITVRPIAKNESLNTDATVAESTKRNDDNNHLNRPLTNSVSGNNRLVPLIKSSGDSLTEISRLNANMETEVKKKRGRPKRPNGVAAKPSTFKLKNISFSYKDKSDKLKTKARVKTAHLGPVTLRKK